MSNLLDLINNPETKKRKIDWLVEGLLKTNTLNTLCGDPACGKSTLIINMIKNIVDEEDFLGRKTKNVKKVLYVSTEMSQEDVALRFKGIGIKNPEKIEIIGNEKLGIFNLEYVVADCDLIVIDILFDFLNSGCDDSNNYSKVYEFFQNIRHNDRLNKHTWIFVHHLNKSGKVLGSVAIDSAQDTRLTIKMPNDRVSPLRILQAYGKQVGCHEIKYTFEKSNIHLCNDAEEQEEKIDYELAYIIEQTIINKTIEGSSTQISSKLGLSKFGRNPNTLTKYLKKYETKLNENNIVLKINERTHNGRSFKLIYSSNNKEE